MAGVLGTTVTSAAADGALVTPSVSVSVATMACGPSGSTTGMANSPLVSTVPLPTMVAPSCNVTVSPTSPVPFTVSVSPCVGVPSMPLMVGFAGATSAVRAFDAGLVSVLASVSVAVKVCTPSATLGSTNSKLLPVSVLVPTAVPLSNSFTLSPTTPVPATVTGSPFTSAPVTDVSVGGGGKIVTANGNDGALNNCVVGSCSRAVTAWTPSARPCVMVKSKLPSAATVKVPSWLLFSSVKAMVSPACPVPLSSIFAEEPAGVPTSPVIVGDSATVVPPALSVMTRETAISLGRVEMQGRGGGAARDRQRIGCRIDGRGRRRANAAQIDERTGPKNSDLVAEVAGVESRLLNHQLGHGAPSKSILPIPAASNAATSSVPASIEVPPE